MTSLAEEVFQGIRIRCNCKELFNLGEAEVCRIKTWLRYTNSKAC